MYYLGSRYYNPTMCRFISADSVEVIHEADGKLTDKNLFAYCDDNPVMREDGGGEFWSVLAGAVIGAVTNVATTVITGAISGELPNAGQVIVAAVSGAASGALASTGIGVLSHWASQAIGNGVISAAETVASHVAGEGLGALTDKKVWREAVINGDISCAMGALSGNGIAHDDAGLKQARRDALSSWKARNQTLGAVLSGTADRASLHASQQSYKEAVKGVYKAAKPQLLTTNVMFGITTTHGTMLKQINGMIWKPRKK